MVALIEMLIFPQRQTRQTWVRPKGLTRHAGHAWECRFPVIRKEP